MLTPVLDSFADAGGTAGGVILLADLLLTFVVYVAKDVWSRCLKARGYPPTIINPGQLDKSDPLGQRAWLVGSATQGCCQRVLDGEQ